MATEPETPGAESDVADLEERLDEVETRLRLVRERYERLIDQRARLRRETGPDDEFVWTDPERADHPDDAPCTDPPEHPGASPGPDSLWDADGGLVGQEPGRQAYRADGGSPARRDAPGWLDRIRRLFR